MENEMFSSRYIYENLLKFKTNGMVVDIYYNGPKEKVLFSEEDILFLIDKYYGEESID